MALKHAAAPKEETPVPAINVAPVEDTNQTAENGTSETTETAIVKDRSPWTSEKVRTVKSYVREHPGIAFDDLLTALRAGFLADHLDGNAGKQRLLNLLKGIRAKEAQTEVFNATLRAEGKDADVVVFNPLPEVVMPVSMVRPNLLED